MNLLFNLGRRLSGSRILIVGIYRPVKFHTSQNGKRHPLSKLVLEFQRIYGDILIDLDQADGWAFVTAVMDSENNHLAPGFRQTLFDYTGGHPLFTVELLQSLQDRGDLFLDEDQCWEVRADIDWDFLPARIRGIIADQDSRLPPESLTALRTASALGFTFSIQILTCILQKDELEVVKLLGGMLGKEFNMTAVTQTEIPGDRNCFSDQRCKFRNRIYQKYLYESLSEIERMRLHKAASRAQKIIFSE